jgi:hypothetical protein
MAMMTNPMAMMSMMMSMMQGGMMQGGMMQAGAYTQAAADQRKNPLSASHNNSDNNLVYNHLMPHYPSLPIHAGGSVVAAEVNDYASYLSEPSLQRHGADFGDNDNAGMNIAVLY